MTAMETRMSAVEGAVAALEESDRPRGTVSQAQDVGQSDDQVEEVASGEFDKLSTQEATDEAVNAFLRNPAKAKELKNELFLRFALDRSLDEAKARKRLPGAIVDRLMTEKLQASRSWPGDGKGKPKPKVPALLVRFIRCILLKCGETDIGKGMDKRISVSKNLLCRVQLNYVYSRYRIL